MKKLILILIFSISIPQQYNFFQSQNIREEIISRYDNGNKKLVVKYTGYGTEEKIVERITYSNNDKILIIEKPLENIIIKMEYYDNGNLKSEESFKCCKDRDEEYPFGVSKKYYENGKIEIEIEYINDKLYVNNYFNENNEQTVISGNGKIDVYKYGVLIEQTPYSLGLVHGMLKTFYTSGKLKTESKYESGEQVGKTIYYDENPKNQFSEQSISENNDTNKNQKYKFYGKYLEIENKLNFEYDSEDIVYDENGVMTQINYRKNSKIFRKDYYYDGELDRQLFYINNNRFMYKWYYKQQLDDVWFYDDNNNHDVTIDYDSNGNIISESKCEYYLNNNQKSKKTYNLDGEMIEFHSYDRDGKIEHSKYYENNILIKEYFWKDTKIIDTIFH